MNPEVAIHIATVADAHLLTSLSVSTFIEAFGEQNTQENMDIYIEDAMNEAAIKAELEDAQNLFYIAYYKNEIAGYTKLRLDSVLPELAGKQLEIARIYVRKKFHNQKIGSVLMKKCVDYALETGYNVVWLGVWEHNEHAIRFYKRWGFDVFGNHGFQLGNDAQTDILMEKRL